MEPKAFLAFIAKAARGRFCTTRYARSSKAQWPRLPMARNVRFINKEKSRMHKIASAFTAASRTEWGHDIAF